jgi:hypothetical protein
VASTWAALSQLRPGWLPHVAGRKGSRQISCSSARSGQACAKESDWPGARDPVIPRGHTGMWVGVQRKNPSGFWAKRQVFDVLPQRLAGRKRVSPAARCGEGRLVRD